MFRGVAAVAVSANGSDGATDLSVSPDGPKIAVTGWSDGGSTTRNDYATVAYNTANGSGLWVKRFNSPANGYDNPNSIAVSPDSTKAFVTGGSGGGSAKSDLATVAYTLTRGTDDARTRQPRRHP